REQILARARQVLERAEELVPARADNHANLARLLGHLAHQRKASPESAFAEFDAALDLDTSNVYLYSDAGQTALLLGDGSRAQAYAVRGNTLFPDFGPLLAQLAYVAFQHGQKEEAIDFLRKAVEGNWYGNNQGREAAGDTLRRLAANWPP